MKKIISHRGNLKGPNPSQENKPWFIDAAIEKGFDVEVDVWLVNDLWFLGHDEPEYKIDRDFLNSRSGFLWCHAKNINALKGLLDNKLHCFFHHSDPVTLTSKGFIWTYPGGQLTSNSICLMPENFSIEVEKYFPSNKRAFKLCYGVCTDFPVKYLEATEP